MDRCNQLQDHLAQAQRELAEVAARIERQKALIRKLERGGQDTAHAAFLLQQSLGLKALNEAHRARLQRELESLGSSRVQAAMRLPLAGPVTLGAASSCGQTV